MSNLEGPWISEEGVWTLFYMLSGFSRGRLFAGLWIVVLQAPLSMGFSREECWGGLPFPSLGDLPNPRVEPASLMSPALAERFVSTGNTCEAFSFMGSKELSSRVTWSHLGSSHPPQFLLGVGFGSSFLLYYPHWVWGRLKCSQFVMYLTNTSKEGQHLNSHLRTILCSFWD